ncbi:RDD family protein [Bacteriovorax sp. BSW11_IV]|uniref:RDD family protein n=1 Tax=Bacteriovorax sp. BSW11_IV TaxID=1353529 RepID=UPI00038A159E|nr:RDD family protein [Bacteriovorax sp. BSW11_IV]EQC50259.1 RDD family protein [Bacteriovorax sp. BSW11_IV]
MAKKKKQEEILSYRILAFSIDFLLSFLVMGILFTLPSFMNFFESVYEIFPSSASFIVVSYCLYLVMRFYFALFFATTPGHLFSGLSIIGKGRFSKRIRLCVRFLLSPIFLLLGPSDIISRGHGGIGDILFDIRYRVGKVPRAISLVLILGLLGMVPGSIAFWNLAIFDKVQVEYKEFGPQKLSNKSHFNLYETIQSNVLHFSTFSSLGDGLFTLLPSLKLEKSGKYIRFSPEVNIYNNKKKIFSEFSIFKSDIDFVPLFKKAFQLDRFLQIRYAKLYEALEGGKEQLSENEKAQFKEIILNSMGVNLNKIYKDFRHYGPYPYGHFLIRKNLLEILDIGDEIKFDHVRYGDGDFIRVSKISELTKMEHSYYLPLLSLKTPLFELRWPLNDESKSLFESSVLAQARWQFDSSKKIPFPRSSKEMNPLFIVDYFKDKDLGHEQRLHFEDYVYGYYFNLARNSVLVGDHTLRNRLYSILERLKEIVHLQNQENPIYSDKFENRLTNLMKALAKEERKYFNI